jgi:hypothetical protein
MAEKDEVVIETGTEIAVTEDATMTDKVDRADRADAEETCSRIAEATDAMTTDAAAKTAMSLPSRLVVAEALLPRSASPHQI